MTFDLRRALRRVGQVRRYASVHLEPPVQGVRVDADPDVRRTLGHIFGREPTDQELAHLASATHGSTVEVTPGPEGVFMLQSNNPKTESFALRTLAPGHVVGGAAFGPTVHNDVIELRGDDLRTGLPMFRRQVQAARALGVHRLKVAGAVGDYGELSQPFGASGYYVWPRFGFQGSVPRHLADRLPVQVRRQLGGFPTLHRLFGLPGGPSAWKRYGASISDLEFDPRQGSPHSQRLEAYTKTRQQRRLSRR